MELNEVVKEVLKNITYEEYLEQEKRASMAKKFRFDEMSSFYSSGAICSVCGKTTKRYGWAESYRVCSSCARKIARAVMLSISLKRIHSKEYSKGVRYGYTMATRGSFGVESALFIQLLIDDAKLLNKTVHFLGRDMDAFFVCFNLEDNVNYLPGWNRSFNNASYEKKIRLLDKNNFKPGDYVIDTGFAGSILREMEAVIEINGYLLSANDSSIYTSLYNECNYAYRDWVCEIEHINRARRVIVNPEIGLPVEVYEKPDWYEKGFFHGFVRGINKAMHD